MKIYDIPVRNCRKEFDVSTGYQKEFDISINNRHEIPLVIESLPNKFLLNLQNDLFLYAKDLSAEVTLYKTFAVNHTMVFSGDIITEAIKEMAVLNEFVFDHELSVQTEQTVALSENTLILNEHMEFTNTRYRLLGDIDALTLAELDGYTLEELDYLTIK